MSTRLTSDSAPIGNLLPGVLAAIDERTAARSEGRLPVIPNAVPTGFTGLDLVLGGGLRPGTLTVIAGHPGAGMDDLALQMAACAGKSGTFSAFFNFDMDRSCAAQRLLALEAGVPTWNLACGKVSPDQRETLAEAAAALSRANLFVDDDPSTSHSLDRRMEQLLGMPRPECGIIFVDDLSHAAAKLATGAPSPRANGDTAFEMKRLAERFGMPVVLLAGLEDVPLSPSCNPVEWLGCLRASGPIELRADIIIFLDRFFSEEEAAVDGRPGLNEARLILAKNRFGGCGSFRIAYDTRTGAFGNLPADSCPLL